MKVSDYHLGFIGFGHMAQVIFKAIDRAKLIPRSQLRFIQRDPHKMRENEQQYGITSTSLARLVEVSDVILLGVRPNQAKTVLEQMREIDESKKIISILAGVKLSYYRRFLKNPILRVMPNIASEVGMGMSVFSFTPQPTPEFRSLANVLFSCMGEVIEVPEKLMDIACGIASSGLGFVFRLIDAMAKEGEKEGLSDQNALKMAAQTFMGAARLVQKRGEVKRLIEQIATPNGTTEAGFKAMSESHIEEHFQKVVQASSRRSKDLSEEFQ